MTELDLYEQQGILPTPRPGETQDEANHRVCCDLYRNKRYAPLHGPLSDWLDNVDNCKKVIESVTQDWDIMPGGMDDPIRG
jgi:hypothetical protein